MFQFHEHYVRGWKKRRGNADTPKSDAEDASLNRMKRVLFQKRRRHEYSIEASHGIDIMDDELEILDKEDATKKISRGLIELKQSLSRANSTRSHLEIPTLIITEPGLSVFDSDEDEGQITQV